MRKFSLPVLLALMAVPALATGSYSGPGGDWEDDAYDGTLGSMFSSTVTVPAGEPDGDVITDIWVEMNAYHTWVGDLVIKLEGPAGLITLMSRPGYDEEADDGEGCCGNSADWLNTDQYFDDDGPYSAEDFGAYGNPADGDMWYPDGGINGPMSLIGSYAGTNAVGNWTLYVGDSAGGDEGYLNDWTLHLTTTPEPSALALLGLSLLLVRRR